jgi:thiol-disulfide isomerase/thioredoxin
VRVLVVLLLLAGLLIWSPSAGAPVSDPSTAHGGDVRAASAFAAFRVGGTSRLAAPALDDAQVTGLLTTLDELLAASTRGSGGVEQGRDALWQFSRKVQSGLLGPGQETRILTHLGRVASRRPELAPSVERARRLILRLSIGKTAPEIVGRDLEGRPFRLTDYRERAVALVFSADWCAICRTLEPYERFLAERYAKWPFAIVGVQTGASREQALGQMLQTGLPHRAFWDEPGESAPNGQIADDWNVMGWPATYLIDGEGVIRFVDVRDEDLLKGVRQLVEEQVDRDDRRARARARDTKTGGLGPG